MGNTPSQRPFEDDASEGEESTPGAALTTRFVRAVRSFAAACRRRVARPVSRSSDPSFEGNHGDANGQRSGRHTTDPDPPAVPATSEYESVEELPTRETPFTYPASNCEHGNGSDLQSTESDDGIAIYYPNCPGATIESDTWEQVER